MEKGKKVGGDLGSHGEICCRRKGGFGRRYVAGEKGELVGGDLGSHGEICCRR